MEAIFNRPVAPRQFQESARIGFVRAEGCDAVGNFEAFFARGNFLGFPFYAKDLSDMGKIEETIKICAAPDLSDFMTAVCFFRSAMLRGENRSD